MSGSRVEAVVLLVASVFRLTSYPVTFRKKGILVYVSQQSGSSRAAGGISVQTHNIMFRVYN
jgi:hypothetical protein